MKKLVTGVLISSLAFGAMLPTTGKYGAYEDFEAICKKEFGERAKVARWEEIKKEFNSTQNKEELIKALKFTFFDQTYIINHKNGYWEEGDRHFIITYHNKKLPTTYLYLVHDTIDNHLLDLGSWNELNYPILCNVGGD